MSIYTLLIYGIYISLTLIGVFAVVSRKHNLLVTSLILLAPIDVTAFLNAGIAFTGFFTVLFIAILFELLDRLFTSNTRIKVNGIQYIYIFFIVAALATLVFSFYYELSYGVGEHYDQKGPERLLRSAIRYGLTIFGLLLISSRVKNFSSKRFSVTLALAGLLPAICIYIEWFSSAGLQLYQNNKTFMSIPAVVSYFSYHVRPVGLSNEASFFAYMECFSVLATFSQFFCTTKPSKGPKIIAWLIYYIAQLGAIALSMSRTGLVLALIGSLLLGYWETKKHIKKLIVLIPVLAISFLATLYISSFITDNVIKRYSSLFILYDPAKSWDVSNLERYGNALGLLNMLESRNPFVGVGYQNYYLHLKEYLPLFLTERINYDRSVVIPSFNLWLQVAVEFGFVWFLFLSFLIFINYKKFARQMEAYPFLSSENILLKSLLAIMAIAALSVNIFAFSTTFLPILFSSIITLNAKKAVDYARP